jgi:hypothetical protein
MPPDVVHRLWDIFLAHANSSITASAVLIAMAIALFRMARSRIMEIDDIAELEDIMNTEVHAVVLEQGDRFWRLVGDEIATLER